MGKNQDVQIEALEHQLMRAWLGGDRKSVKGLLSSRFRMVVGAASPVLLDRKSFVEAVGERWTLGAYRFGTSIYSRDLKGSALFAAEAELSGRIEGVDISGSWWIADLWQRSGLSRRWQLVDRQLARPETAPTLPAAVRALQLWR